MFVRQQYRREYGKGLPHKKPIASETDACKMKSFARLGGLKEAPASIGGEYFTVPQKSYGELVKFLPRFFQKAGGFQRRSLWWVFKGKALKNILLKIIFL